MSSNSKAARGRIVAQVTAVVATAAQTITRTIGAVRQGCNHQMPYQTLRTFRGRNRTLVAPTIDGAHARLHHASPITMTCHLVREPHEMIASRSDTKLMQLLHQGPSWSTTIHAELAIGHLSAPMRVMKEMDKHREMRRPSGHYRTTTLKSMRVSWL